MQNRRSFFAGIAGVAAAFFAPDVLAAGPNRRRHRRRPNTRRTTLPALCGSQAAIDRENAWIGRHNLTRFADRDALRRAIAEGELKTVVRGKAWRIDPELGENDRKHKVLYRHALPCVHAFMRELMLRVHRATGDVFLVTSLVRTEQYQLWLRDGRTAEPGQPAVRPNPNATVRSSHCAGVTIDFRTTNLSLKGLQMTRRILAQMEADGRVQATEEVRNGVFHVSVRVDFDNRD